MTSSSLPQPLQPSAKIEVTSGHSSPRKLQAAFLLSPDAYRTVYSETERGSLAALAVFPNTVLNAQNWTKHRDVLREVEALFTGWDAPRLDAEFLAACPALRVVFHAAGSIKFMVTEAFWQRNLRVTSAAPVNAIPTAEFAFAQIILALKHTWRAALATRAARRFVRDDALVPSAYRSTVGILSLGTIGRLVVDRLRGLDVSIIAYDPCVSPSDAASLGVELVSLTQVFARADVVSCHTPLLPATKRLIREHHFAAMKPGATFINTARGAVIDEREMIAVLRRRPDIFAAIDVTDPEPPPPESPLYDLPNVIVTPHIAGSIGRECQRMGRMMVSEARRYLAGEPLRGEVFEENLSSMA